MLERLGNVLFWLGSAIAVIFVIGAVVGAVFAHDKEGKMIIAAIALGCAVGAYLCGLAARYILGD